MCTREAGKNGALMNALKARGVRCLELPLVEAVPGDDAEALPDVLTKERWDWVCVTSPEAAKVFLRGYEAAGRPEGVRVAVVGAATGRALAAGAPDAFALEKQFIPSKATAATMARELPCEQGSFILYPASKRAASTLEDGLEARGATVVRLNTYSTERVASLDPADIARAVAADVVTFGSPSAVRAWVELCGDALYDHLVQNEGALQARLRVHRRNLRRGVRQPASSRTSSTRNTPAWRAGPRPYSPLSTFPRPTAGPASISSADATTRDGDRPPASES